ncbi:MAG: hydrogenase formation protein HypD [Methanobacteriota archaeon]
MRHDIFNDKTTANRIIQKIREFTDDVKIMHVCGTHEQTITKNGLRTLLPENIKVVPGPGCPVCITPASEINSAIQISRQGAIITTYGDMLRVPGTTSSLAKEKANGGDVRVVYSPFEAADIARRNPDKQVVFLGIGFETTAPMTAHVLKNATENFSVLCSHRLVPPAMELLLKGGYDIDGFIDPGHVSTIIGISPYEKICEEFHTPQVIAGFEPLDVLMSIFMILEQLKNNTAKVENEYWRAVKPEGNMQALRVMNEVFEPCSKEWRGLPVIPGASLKLRTEFSEFDAEKRFDLTPEGEACGTDCPMCGSILKGISNPQDCELFGKLCTPENPVGACMVSSEGTCNIAYRYGISII